MDPISLATLITTIVIGTFSLIVSLFVGFKSGHFKCMFSDCCTIEMDDDNCNDK